MSNSIKLKLLKTLLVFSLLLVSSNMEAKSNPFIKLFRSYFPHSYSSEDLSNIKSFVGDTIMFELTANASLTNIKKEIPDTVWIKNKKSKKPKEGKDYLLCYNYKGVRNEKSFYTPAVEFNMKPYALLSVKEITEGQYIHNTVGYTLILVDTETTELIYVTLDKDLPYNWKIFSTKANRRINSLMKNPLYYTEDRFSIDTTEYKLTHGELYLTVDVSTNSIHMEPYAQFILVSDSSEPLTLTYDSNHSLGQSAESMEFMSQPEYLFDQEQKRTYSINYELPTDTTYIKTLNGLPFLTIIGVTKSYSNTVSQTIEPGYYPLGNKTIPQNTMILIGDKITVRGQDYYKACLDGKSFFINCKNVTLKNKDELDTLLQLNQRVRDAFFDSAKILSRFLYLNKRQENLDKFNEYANRGIIVVEAQPYDMSEYTDGTGMSFSIINTAKKTIKYITFNFTGYNAVDDPVSSRGVRNLSRRGIGPIETYETASYDYEYVWWTDIVEYSNIRSIVVQYKDGTSRTFTGNAVKIIPEEILDALDYKSPVDSFLPSFSEDDD